jgi:hypothetical protein
LARQEQKNRSESTSSREAAASSKGVPAPALADDLASSITRQKVAAAKQYIENHYKSQMKNLQERKERYAKLSLSLSLSLSCFAILFWTTGSDRKSCAMKKFRKRDFISSGQQPLNKLCL